MATRVRNRASYDPLLRLRAALNIETRWDQLQVPDGFPTDLAAVEAQALGRCKTCRRDVADVLAWPTGAVVVADVVDRRPRGRPDIRNVGVICLLPGQSGQTARCRECCRDVQLLPEHLLKRGNFSL